MTIPFSESFSDFFNTFTFAWFVFSSGIFEFSHTRNTSVLPFVFPSRLVVQFSMTCVARSARDLVIISHQVPFVKYFF